MSSFCIELQKELLALDAFENSEEKKAAVTHFIQNHLTKPPFVKDISFPIMKEVYDKHLSLLREDVVQYEFAYESEVIPFPPPEDTKFTFIDLFAGIGGFRLAMQEHGGKCVFSSEWDKNAKITYYRNFGEFPYGDITKINVKEIPDHDVLCAGFPCQAFSVAGYRQGFDDEKGRGNLFFNILDILKEKKPKAFILENVKNLVGHDKGRTFSRIKEELNNAGYFFDWKILNSKEHGNTPQTRERIFIVGFRSETNIKNFEWPEKLPLQTTIHDLLEDNAEENFYYGKYPIYKHLKAEIKKRDTVYQWRRVYVRENKSNACPTLTANMGTGGHNVPLILDSKDIRKLTPRECARFQGYPDSYKFPKLANSHLYKQVGNSITVTVVKRVAEQIKRVL